MPHTPHSLHYAALLAHVAYKGSSVFGGGQLDLIDDQKMGTQFVIGRDGDCLLLGGRGSDQVIDWMNNFNFWPTRIPGRPGLWHRGFWKAFKPTWGPLKEWLNIEHQKEPFRRALLSGHSAGGPAVEHAGIEIAEALPGISIDAVTFGAPSPYSRGAHDWLNRRFALRRVRNHADIVPVSTMLTLMAQRGELSYFDRDGKRHINPSGWFRFNDRLGSGFERVKDHKPKLYVEITEGY